MLFFSIFGSCLTFDVRRQSCPDTACPHLFTNPHDSLTSVLPQSQPRYSFEDSTGKQYTWQPLPRHRLIVNLYRSNKLPYHRYFLSAFASQSSPPLNAASASRDRQIATTQLKICKIRNLLFIAAWTSIVREKQILQLGATLRHPTDLTGAAQSELLADFSSETIELDNGHPRTDSLADSSRCICITWCYSTVQPDSVLRCAGRASCTYIHTLYINSG